MPRGCAPPPAAAKVDRSPILLVGWLVVVVAGLPERNPASGGQKVSRRVVEIV